VGELHQGAPGLAHGGVLTTAFDEVLGSLNWLIGDPVVTGRLSMAFRAPVPVGATVTIDAQITGVSGRKVFAAAQGTLADGRLAVTAESVFIKVPLEHFIANGNAEHIASAMADRAAGGPAWRAGETQTEVNP
jgi:acyl-coenzyme A thioesterase PaaI-like protein